MDNLDENKSKDLDRNEITKNPDIFLASQLSYNGQLYIDHEFRKKVFVFMGDLDENNGELVWRPYILHNKLNLYKCSMFLRYACFWYSYKGIRFMNLGQTRLCFWTEYLYICKLSDCNSFHVHIKKKFCRYIRSLERFLLAEFNWYLYFKTKKLWKINHQRSILLSYQMIL